MANSNSPSDGSPEGNIKYEPSPINQSVPLGSVNTAPSKPKSKPRKRVNTAEKRHQHNAIERQRRETLNGKFLGLARLLPSLASHRRPSKSAIVNGSISHLTHQRDQRLLAAKLLRQLCAERDQLAKECNEWRVLNGRPQTSIGSAWNLEMEQVCEVEKEQFGSFANVGGDDNENDNDDDEQDQDQDFSSNHDGSSIMFGNQFNNGNSIINPSNGLITPRSSTDMDSTTLSYNNYQQNQQANRTMNLSGSINSNWSNDFSFNPQTGSLTNSSTASSLPFSAFMGNGTSDINGLESIADSPTNSLNSMGGIPTPPTTSGAGDFVGFTHTPSPRSSNNSYVEVSGNDSNNNGSNPWTEQQMLFLQSVQQAQLQQRQALHQQQQQQVAMSTNPILFNNSFRAENGATTNATSWHGDNVPSNSTNFTQSLIASMFPQQSNVHVGNGNGNGNVLPQQPPQPPTLSRAQTENMEAWRKLAIGGMMRGNENQQPTVAELKNAIRTGMGIGMNLGNGLWEPNSVKGY